MTIRKITNVVAALALALCFTAPVTRASQRDEATQLTFSQDVQIPGNTVLPAGTYWFVLGNPTADRNIVQVFDLDWRPVTTVIANSTEMSRPSDNTLLTFGQRSSNQPPLLLKWYYPGNTIGHEFAYSGAEAEQTTNIVTVMAQPAY